MKNIKLGKMKPKRQFSPMKATMLLLLLGFAAGNAMAQYRVKPQHRAQPDKKGLYMNKEFKQASGDQMSGTLTLDSYVTGEVKKVQTSIPTDIVLVLDNSWSMDAYRTYKFTAQTSGGGFTYDECNGNTTYYYKDEDGCYYSVKPERSNRRYYLYFEKTATNYSAPNNSTERYYLKGTQVYDDLPTGVTSSNGNIWTGVLYTRQNDGYRIAALRTAVKNFIEVIAKDATDHPWLDEYGVEHPVDHRISIVTFNNQAASISVAGQTGLMNVNQYKNQMITAVDGIQTPHVYGTRQDYGLSLALEKLPTPWDNEEGYEGYDRKNVVVLFTDGEPQGNSSGATPSYAPNCVAAALPLKQIPTSATDNKKGATVYSVGVFGSDPKNYTLKMISYISSNYPNAQNMTTIGTPADTLKYSMTAESPEELAHIFEAIASESGGSTVDMGSQTVVQDVISDYFQLPLDAEGNPITTGIKVYTAECIGVDPTYDEDQPYTPHDDYDSKGRKFDTPEEVTNDPQYRLSFLDNSTSVQVTGFDFKTNWCGIETVDGNPIPHGMKLILEIPIVAKPDAWGDNIPTNGAMSVISENDTIIPENVIDYFISPEHTIHRDTWVEAVTSEPQGWDLNNMDSREDLAWFISYVNGYNNVEGGAHPGAEGVLTADVDMSAYNWVPIGGTEGYYIYDDEGNPTFVEPKGNEGFKGTFDGGGHSITGLRNQPSKVFTPGLFGKVNGGTVKNTFVMDCDFNTGCEGYFGIIADTLCNGGVIYNCEAAGQLKSCDVETEFLNPFFDPKYLNPDDPAYNPSHPNASTTRKVDPKNIFLGGLVGLVDASEVHSCISVAELYGYSMGGLVNETRGDNAAMENSYSYPTFFHWVPSQGGKVGGLVADNQGKLVNCYIRERARGTSENPVGGIKYALERIDAMSGGGKADVITMYKGLLVGVNSGSASYLYMPDAWWEGDTPGQNYVGKGSAVSHYGKFSITETPYMYLHKDNQVTMLGAKDGETKGLLATLNSDDWKGTPSRATTDYTYTTWFRTTADGINNDYPVLKIMDFNSVGSDDLIRLYYGDINHMMGSTSMYSENKDDDTYCIYQNAAVTTGNNGATLYINEDVAITQTTSLDAYVGITLDNSAGANGAMSGHPTQPNPNDVIDWHMFSTSLSNAPLGINYTDSNVHNFSYNPNDNPDYYFFPEVSTGATVEVVKDGYFPSHTYGKTSRDADYNYNADWDFYTFEEKYHHWMNFKRNSVSHWDEDPETGHANLKYDNTNESELVPGKGYLLAVANETFLQSHGTLNSGELNYIASYTSNPFTTGYNLIGNPYQSYLNFSKFVANNSSIDSYVILDEDFPGYVTVAANGSANTYPEGYAAPGNLINMHQGFFIHVSGETKIVFNNEMRSIDNSSEQPTFRGAQHNYPLVNLVVKEANGTREYLTVETNRPSIGGAKKMKGLRAGNAQMFAHADNADYAILFATEDMNEVPVRFSTEADATYTMIWNTQNGEFTKLQLIDNITGVTVDMLASDEYTFTSKTTDFESRFRLVFHAIDNDEDDGEAETEDGDFAFFDGSNLVVSGAGMLSVCDINGRVIYSTNLNGTQSSVSMPDMARGLYLLRLTNSASTKVQKIVIRK